MNKKSLWKDFRPLIWGIGTFFTLLQFFLQLSSGVVIDIIRHEMRLTALGAGLLSGLFYVIYTCLQIPAGVLCDRHNPRFLLTFSALIFSLGSYLFANGHSFHDLYIGRGILAIGSSFSFVCLTHLLRKHYPLRQFGVLIGASETLSFLAAVIGIMGLGAFIGQWGWREFMNMTAIAACLVAYLCWRYIPSHTSKTNRNASATFQIVPVLTSKPLWINGLFVGLTFLMVTVFGALWAPPFLQIKLQCTLAEASVIDGIFIFGVGISCPIFGYLANKVKSRRLLIIRACLASIAMLLLILYLPIHHLYFMGLMMFALGLMSGSYILGFTFANELSPPHALSTTTGFTNTLALMTTPILQPFIGYVLDTLHNGRAIRLQDYQEALLILPAAILIATILVAFLKIPNHK